MGVLFECVKVDYSCAYGSCNIIRVEILQATIRYLENKKIEIAKIQSNCKITNSVKKESEEKQEYDKEVYELYDTDTKINEILVHKNKMAKGVDDFLSVMHNSNSLIDNFIYLDIYGCYALLNKSDCEGYYSPGNSFDILSIINTVKPFITDKNVLERLKHIVKLFMESVKLQKKITIM